MSSQFLKKPDKIQLISKKETFFYNDNNKDFSLSFDETERGSLVTIKAENKSISFIKLRWYIEIDPNSFVFGDAFERDYGNLMFTGITPERLYAWYCIVSDEEGNTGYGVRVRPNALCFWQIDTSGVTLTLDVRCGSNDYILNGQLELAEIVTAYNTEDTFDFMKSFCGLMSDNPLLVDKPIYGFNNWYYAYGNSSHQEILGDATLLSKLTKGLLNRPYMVIDDGWQEGEPYGTAIGTVGCITNSKFPDMKKLAEEISNMDIIPGIWIRPLRMNPLQKHPNISLLRDEEFLDPSCDETLALISKDMDRITKDWGYKLVKFDFATYDIFGKYHKNVDLNTTEGVFSLRNNMTNAQAVKRLYKTIYEHSNNAIIIGCNSIPHLGSGYFHIHRSGDDTSGYHWERTRKQGINALAYRMCQHKQFFDIDADCVGILNNNIPWQLNSMWLDLLSNSGTPLFVSAKPSSVTPEIEKDLKEAFIRASRQTDTCRPINLKMSCPEIWLINGKYHRYIFNDIMGADPTVE